MNDNWLGLDTLHSVSHKIRKLSYLSVVHSSFFSVVTCPWFQMPLWHFASVNVDRQIIYWSTKGQASKELQICMEKINQVDAILAKDFALSSGLAHHWKTSLLCDFLTPREIRLYECFLWRRATAQPSHNPKDLCGYWPTAQVVKKDIGSKYYTVPWSWEIICSLNREEIKPDKCWQTFACSFSSSGV